MKSLLQYIRSGKGFYLTGVIAGIAIFLPTLIFLLVQALIPNSVKILHFVRVLIVMIFFLLTGCIGLIYIIRKEIGGLFHIQGKLAQAYGFIVFICSLALACYSFLIMIGYLSP